MDILKPKRGKHTTIQALNPILQEGEIVFEKSDDGSAGYGLIKMGDGVTPYNNLPPFLKAISDYIPISEKGKANGVVPLNSAGTIDSNYLPSYVDDVLEFPSFEDFPAIGETGKLYVDISGTSNNVYRWSGTQYIGIATSVTYTLEKSGSSVVLKGSNGSQSTVSNIGGVEVRTNDPPQSELYPGKMWIINS